MGPEEMETAWADFLARRKKDATTDPDFTRRVMESVRALEASRTTGTRFRPTGADDSPVGALARILQAWLRPRLMMAMASVLLLAGTASLYVGADRDPVKVDADVTRIKGGGFDLDFVLKRGSRIETAKSGDVYLPGDRLQAVYSSEAGGFIHLFSIDETGVIACFSCQGGTPKLPAGQGKTLSYALELDGSPRTEAMVGFWTPGPTSPAVLEKHLRTAWEKAARNLTALQPFLASEMPKNGRVSVFRMHKRRKI